MMLTRKGRALVSTIAIVTLLGVVGLIFAYVRELLNQPSDLDVFGGLVVIVIIGLAAIGAFVLFCLWVAKESDYEKWRRMRSHR